MVKSILHRYLINTSGMRLEYSYYWSNIHEDQQRQIQVLGPTLLSDGPCTKFNPSGL